MKITIERLNVKEHILAIVLLLFFGENFFAQFIPAFRYLDEILAVVAILYILFYYNKIKQDKYSFRILLLCAIMVAAGIVYNIMSGLIKIPSAILIDAFGVIKNHIIFIAFSCIAIKDVNYDKLINYCTRFIKVFVVIVFIFGVINFFHDIGMSYDVYNSLRYGMRSYEFLYTNPAMVGIVMISCVLFLDYTGYSGIIKWLAFGSMILTLRTAVLSTIAVYVMLYLFFKFFKKLKWYHMALLILIITLVGWRGISEYFLSGTTNRSILLIYGIKVFERYFPFGSGFATYGSQMAYTYYSPLYTEFGFQKIWGLNEAYGGTVNDNFWPMIMAQLGVVGILAMGYICYAEFQIINNLNVSKQLKVGLLTTFLSLMIGTVASADLTGVAGTIRYFPLALVIIATRQGNSNKELANG
jgi:hypothetical protein